MSVDSRRFGVEIEHGTNGQFESVNAYYHSIVRADKRFRYINIDEDGTEYEVKTPILRGKSGYAYLSELMLCLQELGGYVTRHDGLHVHHEGKEFIGRDGRINVVRLLQLEQSWINNQEQISRFCAPHRKIGAYSYLNQSLSVCECAAGLCDNCVCAMEHYDYNSGKCRALNTYPLKEYGTIEMRLMEGTLDGNRACSWVEFGQRFISSALSRKKPIDVCPDPDAILRRIKYPRSKVEHLYRIGK